MKNENEESKLAEEIRGWILNHNYPRILLNETEIRRLASFLEALGYCKVEDLELDKLAIFEILATAKPMTSDMDLASAIAGKSAGLIRRKG